MRKIVSKEDEDKKKKKRQLIIGGILILVMLLSTAGYSFSQFFGSGGNNNNNQQLVYHGFQFVKQNNFWITNVSGLELMFTYNPTEINNSINIDTNLTLNSYYQQPFYIYSEDPIAEQEISRNLNQIILRGQYACLQGENCSDNNFPIKTCDNNFILIKESNSSEIKQQGKCIFIEGKQEDLTKLTDEFLFKISGINSAP
jgi:hypothetical protein